MRNSLEVDLVCCICKDKAEYVKELERDKGWEYFCEKHFTDTETDRIKRDIIGGKYG